MGLLKQKAKKKGARISDSEDDSDKGVFGDQSSASASTTSGHTADGSFADWNQDSTHSNQQRPAGKTTLAGKLVSEWKKKKLAGSTQSMEDDASSEIQPQPTNYEDPFSGEFVDDYSANYLTDGISAIGFHDDESKCSTYLEDDPNIEGLRLVKEQLSSMSALRKTEKSKKNSKVLKKKMEPLTTLDEAGTDDEEIHSSGGEATGASTGSSDDEYDSFFDFLDKEKKEEKSNTPDSTEPVKKAKKKVKKVRQNDEAADRKKSKKKDKDGKKKKGKDKKKKIKKEKSTSSSDSDLFDVVSPDLLSMVSPESTMVRKTILEEEAKSKPIAAPPHSNLLSLEDRLANARARRDKTKSTLSTPLSLDDKPGSKVVDRSARQAIRRCSMGRVEEVARRERKSRFDEIIGGDGRRNRQKYRQKSLDALPLHP